MTDTGSELDRLRAENKQLRSDVEWLRKFVVNCPDCRRLLDHLHESHVSVEERWVLEQQRAAATSPFGTAVNAALLVLMLIVFALILLVVFDRAM